jgi:putative phosphoribosyl transferase
LQGKTVILADDGIATGATITLAVHAIRQRGARKIVVAVPVAPHQIISQLRLIADEVICLLEPERFWAVGQWYESFPQLNDGEVCRIMDQTLSQLPESQAA